MKPDKAATDARLNKWKAQVPNALHSTGWCGWYKNWFFRSIIELSFVIEHLEAVNKEWRSGETPEFAIPYVDEFGVSRNYFPDFFLPEKKVLVEVKPNSMMTDKTVLIKKAAAKKWCEERGYRYILFEPKSIDHQKLVELHDTQQIKFTKETEQKYKWKLKRMTY